MAKGNRGGKRASGGNFANSLVKDTVYHGTNIPNITKFSTSGKESNGAIYFANDIDYAEEEAYVKGSSTDNKYMYSVKLNIQNPMKVTLTGGDFADPTVERKYIQQARKTGKDAVIFDNGETGIFYQEFYAVFDPKQIKINGVKKI